jgi:hypothetical protein
MNKKLALGIMCTVAICMCCGFGAAGMSKFGSIGRSHKIEMYSGGVKVREWISDGRVENEESSDGFYFCEKSSGVLVRVSGDIVITQM